MNDISIPLQARKRIALVAHDNMKAGLYDWVRAHVDCLREHTLFATGTTGAILERELGLSIARLESGPLGGDQQIGAMISKAELDFLIFFWDPLEQLPHDPDVKALLRMVNVWNIPMACNRSSADFMISSPLMAEVYPRQVPDYSTYRSRRIASTAVAEDRKA